MALILMNTPIGKRVNFIDEAELDSMLEAGTAKKCEGYDLYEAVTKEEISQGYMTRNMEALPVSGRKRGRPPKPKLEAVMADENEIVEDEIVEQDEAVGEEAADESADESAAE